MTTNNPLAELGFGLGGNTQSWQNIISAIKLRCGVNGVFEFTDEKLVEDLLEQVMPFYSIYDGYPRYLRLTPDKIIGRDPVKVYDLSSVPKIVSIREIIKSEHMTGASLDENVLHGAGGTDTLDLLLQRNHNDIRKIAYPVTAWKFKAPDKLEFIDIAAYSNDHDIIAELNVQHPDPSSVNPTMYQYFKDMCVGFTMINVGTIREKVEGVTTPIGDIRTNGSTLKQDGVTMLQEVKQDLINTPPDQHIFHF